MKYSKVFGIALRELREQMGFTQVELSSPLGLTDGTAISKIEAGKRRVYLDEAIVFADILNINFVEFIERVERKRKELTAKT